MIKKRLLVAFVLFFSGVAPVTADTQLAAAVLPASRTVQVGESATLFATIINGGAEPGANCRIEADPLVNVGLSYQTTDSATNQVTGTADTPVDIAVGAAQSFLIVLTPSVAIEAVSVKPRFVCDNAADVARIELVNTFVFAASTTPTSDIVALVATPNSDGVTTAGADSGISAFSVATLNLGVSEEVSFTALVSGQSLPVTVTLCETNPTSGACINPTVPSAAPVVTTIGAGATPTFAVFVTATGPVSFDPAVNRIFLAFDAPDGPRGASSVAVRRATLPAIPVTSALVTGTTLWHGEAQAGRLVRAATAQTFAADGTGVSYEEYRLSFPPVPTADLAKPFTWQISDGVLEQTFSSFEKTASAFFSGDFRDLEDIYGLPDAVWQFLGQRYNSGEFVEPFELEQTILSRRTSLTGALSPGYRTSSEVTEFYSADAMLLRNGWTDPLPDGVVQQRAETQAMTDAVTLGQAAGQQVVAGEQWVVPLPFTPIAPSVVGAVPGYNADLLMFEATGTTNAGLYSGQTYSWSNAGNTLVLTSGDEEYRFTTWSTLGNEQVALIEYRVGGDLQLVFSYPIGKLDSTGDTLGPALMTSGTEIWQAGLNLAFTEAYLPSGLIRPGQVFGYNFPTAADAGRIFGNDPESGECADDTLGCFSLDPTWTWQVTGNVIQRSRDAITTFRTRTWHVLSYTGDRAVVLEAEIWSFGDSAPEFLLPPRLNTLEKIDLNQWPAELANSSGF